MKQDKYKELGVSSDKKEVHNAIRSLSPGLFPGSFCKIFADTLTGSPDHGLVAHADGTGTKSVMAYHYWKETGDLNVFHNLAIDAVVMNLDDMICVGALGPFTYTQNINRNSVHIPYEVIEAIIAGTAKFFEVLEKMYDIKITYNSGETADLNDAVRTLTLDASMVGRIALTDVIKTNIKPGHVIVGLASAGEAFYEEEYNSGIGSNGITLARHCLFSTTHPEMFEPTLGDKAYTGKYKPTTDSFLVGFDMGQLVLSPTRTYAPVVKEILGSVSRNSISAMIHCSGGGQTKCLNFADSVHIIKNDLFEIPPIFYDIQRESDQPWQYMYKTFNMGHRFEIYCDKKVAEKIIEISEGHDVEAKIVWYVDPANKKELTIESPHGTFTY
jgi:phosphoribosylformylglycinamidine cyclo-ligase